MKRSISHREDQLRESRWLCPHCDQHLTYRTYQKHKKLNYDKRTRSWNKCPNQDVSSSCSDELKESGPEFPSISESTCTGADDSLMESCDDRATNLDSRSFTSSSSDDESTCSSLDGQEVWEESSDNSTDCDEGPELPLSRNNTTAEKESILVRWIVIFLLRMQATFYIPNAAVQVLIKFFGVLFTVLGRYSEVVAKIASQFPKSLYELHKQNHSIQFEKFVVCQKCNSIYKHAECLEQIGSQKVSRKCINFLYPGARERCGTALVKVVELGSGKKVFRPYKTYCYNSLITSLQCLLQLEGFARLAEEWKLRESSDLIRDIYDGQIWKDFLSYNGVPFLSEQFSYALALNIDWFQPYKLTESSVGAIYLTILNLPYFTRFKREYVILLGIIQGPSEPKRDVNSFLRPLVSELLDLWKGVPMHVHGYNSKQTIRCALICISSDMPASRKACGFLSHVANLGCSKCKKQFSGGFGNRDYSGFDISNWPHRNIEDHRKSINLILKAKTKTERDQLERLYGCRYTVLLDLPYFDPIRMTIIDPMHNLFLGSAKHVLKQIWVDKGIISREHFDGIQKKMDSVKSPSDIGRIPRKIETGFAGFTADQFKNWTIFSAFHV